MMNNKNKYSLIKNTKYALDGLRTVFKNEFSFRLELILFSPVAIIIILLNVSFILKLFLIVTGVLIFISEIFNSAVENVVDLVTKEHHELAKNAKDIAAAGVMVAVALHIFVWMVVLYHIFIL